MKEITRYRLEKPMKVMIDVLLEIDSPFHQRIKNLIKEEAIMYYATTGSAIQITLSELLADRKRLSEEEVKFIVV